MMIFHNIYYYPRETMKLDEVYTYAKNLNYTHVMVVRYNNRGYELLVRHLEGMLAVFKVTSLQFQKQIKHHAVATEHIPELILNNFDSKIGVKVGRLLASLFPQNPEFKGRRVVTFHNQRDFIFFRHHRYIFTEGYEGVNMQEIGPRFTLQVKKVFAGTEEKVGGL
jgi:ribosome production factor 1